MQFKVINSVFVLTTLIFFNVLNVINRSCFSGTSKHSFCILLIRHQALVLIDPLLKPIVEHLNFTTQAFGRWVCNFKILIYLFLNLVFNLSGPNKKEKIKKKGVFCVLFFTVACWQNSILLFGKQFYPLFPMEKSQEAPEKERPVSHKVVETFSIGLEGGLKDSRGNRLRLHLQVTG